MDEAGCVRPLGIASPSDLRIRVLAPVEAPDVPISCLGAFPVTVVLVEQRQKGLDESLRRRLPW